MKPKETGSKEIMDKKFVATPRQIAEIVAYCLSMTIHGNNGKDWSNNVLTAIKGINGTEYSAEKIELEEL